MLCGDYLRKTRLHLCTVFLLHSLLYSILQMCILFLLVLLSLLLLYLMHYWNNMLLCCICNILQYFLLSLHFDYLDVIVLGFQCAYILWFTVFVTSVLSITLFPPVTAVYQPLNVYPVLVGVGKLPYVPVYITVLFPGLNAFPPFTL